MKTSKCKKHGIYNELEAYVYKNEKYKNGIMLRCKKCLAEKSFSNYQKNTATNCYLHGELNDENAFLSVEQGRKRFRCKKCANVRRKKTYAENREKYISDAAKWKRENRERVRELAAQDRLKNPEKYDKWRKDYYERNKKDINTRAVCRLVNLDVSEYEKMIANQNNRCAICGSEETRIWKGKPMRLCIDHDHKTGIIRGLLCHSCNTGLGKFCDSPDLLTKAVIYLMDNE